MKLPVFLLALLLSASCSVAAPQSMRDAQGHTLTLTATPRRIVSLAPGTTEMLYALGLGASVVGDTTYCNYPAAAQRVTKIGDITVSYEKVVALRPDLVVASDANKAAGVRLHQLGLPVFSIAPTSYATVETSLQDLGRLTGTQAKAKHVVALMEAARAYAAHLSRLDPRHLSVLPVVGTGPLFVAGRGTFIGDLITLAGGQSTVAAVPGYSAYSKELVLAHPPDFILADPQSQAALASDPVLGRLAAVRNHRFISINSDILNRPGPRLADALRQMAVALHAGRL